MFYSFKNELRLFTTEAKAGKQHGFTLGCCIKQSFVAPPIGVRFTKIFNQGKPSKCC